MQHTQQTLKILEEALVAKDAPLTLCAWRMEQREKRPLREQVRDAAEVCLEFWPGKFDYCNLFLFLIWPVSWITLIKPLKYPHSSTEVYNNM